MADLTFDRWLDRAETICARRTGLDLDSLGCEGISPFQYDAYDSDWSPAEYVAHVIAESGFPVEAARPATPGTASPKGEPARPGFHNRTLPSNGTVGLALAQRRALGHLPILH